MAAGSSIFYNTNVLNAYVPSTEAADAQARYERLYRQYQNLDLPRIIAVRSDVDIYLDRGSVEIRGSYRIRNRSVKPLRDLHVSIPERVRVNRLTLPAHDVILEDEALGYRIFRLTKPLEPGEAIELGFDLTVGTKGFVNNDTADRRHRQRHLLHQARFLPGHRLRRSPATRRSRRAAAARPCAPRAALPASTISPPAASRPVHPTPTGSTSRPRYPPASTRSPSRRASCNEWVENGRRYFHYRAEPPITHYFAYASDEVQGKNEASGMASRSRSSITPDTTATSAT